MAAIITDRLRLAIVDKIVTIMQDTADPTYIGFGRSEVWNDSDTAPTPINNLDEERKFKNTLQSVKKITGAATVVPRVNWISGTIYHGWDNLTVLIDLNIYRLYENSEFEVTVIYSFTPVIPVT